MDIGSLIDDSVIAITGGTGTLGQAVVAELRAHYHPSKIVVISRGEARQAAMKVAWPEEQGSPLRYRIADVRDYRRMEEALSDCRLVIHAAALKRVEVCEAEPEEALLTNIIGTLNVVKAARQARVERLLFVSSDKACAPIMTYGASKYMAERLVVGFNGHRRGTHLRSACVRYGNVLGSTGSVLHTFRAANGRVPITDPRMTRFWWTPQDAARFVLSSLAMMRGGEVFVPKLQAMRVTDMAAALAPGAEQEVIGLRGPEKLAETMVSEGESLWTMELPDRYVILPALPFWSGASWPEAQRVPEGWSFSSDKALGISKEELLTMVKSDN